MNVIEVVGEQQAQARIWQYVVSAVPLTAATVWVLIAMHRKWHLDEGEPEPGLMTRLCWPLLVFYPWLESYWGAKELQKDQRPRRNASQFGSQNV